ncbi:MAG TPA: oligosaccharide flippase family protein [Bacteroidia bacterium]|nr:oligosaccharide flippase family protein [Bacteroidia bacterium]
MQKKFLTNLGLILFLNLLIKPIYIFGIEKAVQEQVGTAVYGIYFAIFNFSFLLTILLDFGITNFNNKNIAQNSHLFTKHFSSLFTLKLLLAIIYIITVVIIGLVIGYDTRLMKLLLIQGFNMFLIFFINYLRSNLAALHLFKTDGIISVMDRSIMIIAGVFLLNSGVLYTENGIMYFVYTQTCSLVLTAFIAFFIILKKTHSFKLSWNWPFSLMILKKSFPFAILTLLMSFYNRIDSVMIERMLPDGDVQSGIYAQGFRILDATNMIAFLVAGVLLPVFSRMLKQKESVESLVKLISTLLLTPAIVIAVGCFFYNTELIGQLYPQHINETLEVYTLHMQESSKIFSLLMLSFVAISTTYIFGTLLTANGNIKQLNYMAASGMILNIVLNFILIQQFEAYGSAISSMFTQFLTAIIQVAIAQRIFKFKVNYRLINIFITYLVGVIAINYGSKMLHFDWMVNFALMVVSCGLWAFITGIISIKSMFRLLKYG